MAPSLKFVSNPIDTAEANHPDRKLLFDGAFNFRDIGGYNARAGQTVRWRTLFRADALHRLPEEELDLLSALGIRTVLDLRTRAEVEKGHLSGESRGITHLHLPVLGESWKPRDLDPDADAGQVLGDLYIDMLTVGAPALAGALGTLANPSDLPAVFHCAAGKDRTGVLAAMVLSLLGVDEDTIVADYALSGHNMEMLVERLKRERPEALTAMDDQPSAYLAAPPAAMRAFFDHVRTEYGSMDGYVRSIGVDYEIIEALNVTLLQ